MDSQASDTEPPLDGPRWGPASGGPAKQLVVFLHGLGADGNDLIQLAPPLSQALPDAAFVSPDAPEPCDMAPMGRQWFSLRDLSEHSMQEGVSAVAPRLNAFLDAELAKHDLDASRLALVGFSQGTMTALYTGLRREAGPAAIVGFSGMLVAPETLEAEMRCRPPVLLVHGEADEVVPFQALASAEAGLLAAGLQVEAQARADLGHGIDAEGLRLAANFLYQILIAGAEA